MDLDSLRLVSHNIYQHSKIIITNSSDFTMYRSMAMAVAIPDAASW